MKTQATRAGSLTLLFQLLSGGSGPAESSLVDMLLVDVPLIVLQNPIYLQRHRVRNHDEASTRYLACQESGTNRLSVVCLLDQLQLEMSGSSYSIQHRGYLIQISRLATARLLCNS